MNLPPDPESTPEIPLAGLRVLSTRPSSEVDLLKERLEQLGAEVINHPVIELALPDNDVPLRAAAAELERYSMLVFLSRRAVSAAESLLAEGQSVPIAAIGPGTAESLRARGQAVALMPQRSNSESMAAALIGYANQQQLSKPLLVLRGDRGSDVLPEMLRGADVPFAELVVYESRDVEEANAGILQRLSAGDFDWLTVSSSSIAAGVARLFGDAIGQMESQSAIKVASISPTTSQVAKDAGLKISAEATQYNAIGLAEAIVNGVTGHRN